MFPYHPNLVSKILGFGHNELSNIANIDRKTAKKIAEYKLGNTPPRDSTYFHVICEISDDTYAKKFEEFYNESKQQESNDHFKLWLNFYQLMNSPEFKPLFDASGFLVFDYTLQTAIYFEDFINEVFREFKIRADKEWLYDVLNKDVRSPLYYVEKSVLFDCITASRDCLSSILTLFFLEIPSIYTASLEIDLENLYITENSQLDAKDIRSYIPKKRIGKPGACYRSYFDWLEGKIKIDSNKTFSEILEVDDDQLRRWKNPSSPRHYISIDSMRKLILNLKISEFEQWNYFVYFLWVRFVQKHIEEMKKTKFSYTYCDDTWAYMSDDIDRWKKRLQEILP